MYPNALKIVLDNHGVMYNESALESIWLDVKAMMLEYECPDESISHILCEDNPDTFERGLFLDFMAKAVAGMPHWITNGDSPTYKENFGKAMRAGLKPYGCWWISDADE